RTTVILAVLEVLPVASTARTWILLRPVFRGAWYFHFAEPLALRNFFTPFGRVSFASTRARFPSASAAVPVTRCRGLVVRTFFLPVILRVGEVAGAGGTTTSNR